MSSRAMGQNAQMESSNALAPGDSLDWAKVGGREEGVIAGRNAERVWDSNRSRPGESSWGRGAGARYRLRTFS